MEPIKWKERPRIGEDIDKPFFPEKLPNNPNLVKESFWNPRKQIRETINHKAYRRLIMVCGGISFAYLAEAVGGYVSTGDWKVGTSLFLLGILSSIIGRNLGTEYNQKLRDAGHPYIKTREIE